MKTQFQHTALIPLVISERTIVEEIECEVFVDIDLNGEPFVSSIWLDDLAGTSPLNISAESTGAEAHLWSAMKEPAWAYVRPMVAEDLLEAA